jgi:chaperone modulatory protein CbpM
MSEDDILVLELLDEYTQVAFAELLAASRWSREELIELIELGALHPSGDSEASWRFPSAALATVRSAARLRAAFELDGPGLAFALGLLERIEELQRQVRELECQLLR